MTEGEYHEAWLKIDPVKELSKEIEEDIVAELVERHRLWSNVS